MPFFFKHFGKRFFQVAIFLLIINGVYSFSFGFPLVKDGKIDLEVLSQVRSIMENRYGKEYARLFFKAFEKTHETGKDLFRVMPNCFVNQRLMHFSGNALSITFRPTETNTCRFCHQPNIDGVFDDAFRQKVWPQTTHNINPWLNVFDPTWLDSIVPPASIPTKVSDYMGVDNLAEAIKRSGLDLKNPMADFQTIQKGKGHGPFKYFPDLDPSTVNPRNGWANNGWRAFKWKPLPFTYPGALGGWKEIFIRLPLRFRLDENGTLSQTIYDRNLENVERAIKGEDTSKYYQGKASDQEIRIYHFPQGTEFILAIYYLDPIFGKAARIQDYRYMVKSVSDEDIMVSKKEDLILGSPSGLPDPQSEYEKTLEKISGGPKNPYGVIYAHAGWDLLSFLEGDVESGKLRPSIREENQFCIGCHSASIGVVRDGVWSLQRKLPGPEGWQLQDFKGIKDYKNPFSEKGDFYEWITEARMSNLSLFPYVNNDQMDLVGGLPLGGHDHALLLYRKYYQIVKTQTHMLGRFPSASTVPPVVFEKVVNQPHKPLRGSQNSYVVSKRVTDLDFSHWHTAEEARTLSEKEIDKILDRMRKGVIQGTYTAYRRQELIERLEEAKRGLRPSLQSIGKSKLQP